MYVCLGNFSEHSPTIEIRGNEHCYANASVDDSPIMYKLCARVDKLPCVLTFGIPASFGPLRPLGPLASAATMSSETFFERLAKTMEPHGGSAQGTWSFVVNNRQWKLELQMSSSSRTISSGVREPITPRGRSRLRSPQLSAS